MRLRGADLRESRRKALENLEEHNISTTLVVTLQKGLNDNEIGSILEYALSWNCIRGVTFQPIQEAGRHEDYDVSRDRLTLSEVRRMIGEQSDIFEIDDMLPVPCHPDAIAMAYAMRVGDTTIPLTRYIEDDVLLAGPRSTIQFEKDEILRQNIQILPVILSLNSSAVYQN